MSEIVNLRRARKVKARAEAEKKAAENRAAFGTPKAERELGAARTEKAEQLHRGHRLDSEKD